MRFRVELAEGAQPKVTVSNARDAGFDDDAFEMFLVAGDRGAEQFHIGGNAGGSWWDRRLDEQKDWSWNPAIKYRTKRDAAGWEGEFNIPFKELGLPAPKAGDVWRANFVTNRRMPQARLDAWAYWTK